MPCDAWKYCLCSPLLSPALFLVAGYSTVVIAAVSLPPCWQTGNGKADRYINVMVYLVWGLIVWNWCVISASKARAILLLLLHEVCLSSALIATLLSGCKVLKPLESSMTHNKDLSAK